MLAFGTLFTLALIAVWLYALFDSVTCPEGKIRSLQKPLWVLIVLLFTIFGAAAWFLFGRPRDSVPFRSNHPGANHPSRGGTRRTLAPDDDPDFLRSLNQPRDGNDPKNPA